MTFFISINGIGGSWWESGSRRAFEDVSLDAYLASVDKVYAAGARNFLIINVSPVDRSQILLSTKKMLVEPAADPPRQKTVIDGFDLRLTERVAEFDLSGKGVKALYYDSNTRVSQILDNPYKSALLTTLLRFQDYV
ncbi:hypothetical protein FRB98_006105 [Tulasnella sp. 332]|nr:hypothetical protein FRB98_006105 [Tulasnella sp. 332]